MHSHRYKLVQREHTATLPGTRICTEIRLNMTTVLDWPQKVNAGTRYLSKRTWVVTNLKGQKEAAQEIIRAKVSFCFAAHPLFTCNPQIQRSHMAVMRVYKGRMCWGNVLFQEQIAPHNTKSQDTIHNWCRFAKHLYEHCNNMCRIATLIQLKRNIGETWRKMERIKVQSRRIKHIYLSHVLTLFTLMLNLNIVFCKMPHLFPPLNVRGNCSTLHNTYLTVVSYAFV